MEIKEGVFVTLKKQIVGSSVSRAIVYTIGHIIIAMSCNIVITGALPELAVIDAIVEPCINGVWYYMLDKYWTSQMKK